MNQYAICYSNRYVVLYNVCPTIRVSLATPLNRRNQNWPNHFQVPCYEPAWAEESLAMFVQYNILLHHYYIHIATYIQLNCTKLPIMPG